MEDTHPLTDIGYEVLKEVDETVIKNTNKDLIDYLLPSINRKCRICENLTIGETLNELVRDAK